MEKFIGTVLAFVLALSIAQILIALQTQKNVSDHKKWLAKTFIDTVTLDMSKIGITDIFSEAVLELYRDIIINPSKYSVPQDSVRLLTWGEDSIVIWGANDTEARCFYARFGTSKERNALVKELNSKLTAHDKVLLEKLIKAVEERNTGIVTKFFL